MPDSIAELTQPLPDSRARLDYDAALRRVMELTDFERSDYAPRHGVFHLERISMLLDRLGNPHLQVPAVHVAGSKGKGSTSAIVASILDAAGYVVGLYTSPHLHTVVERIRVGPEPIECGVFASLVERTWDSTESIGREGRHGAITFFELLTAMAFLHFKEVGADFQVIEVGLGGRLDATNVVRPEVSVITSISLDHISVLGDRLDLIAAEKAGIIKRSAPVVLSPQPPEATDVFVRVAAQRGSRVVQVGKEVTWRKLNADLKGQSFDVVGLRDRYHLWMPLLGDHQLENAATAVAAVEALVEKGIDVPREGIVEGLRRVRWPGRFQVLSRDGVRVVVDGAHNPESMRRLVKAVSANFEFRRLIVVFGGTSGHSVRGMMTELAPLAPDIVAVRSRHPRSAPSQIIARTANERGLSVLLQSEDIGVATRRAVETAGEEDLVLGTGSLSVVGEVIEEIEGVAPELYPNLKRPASISDIVG